jgi:twitching motility protein PilT
MDLKEIFLRALTDHASDIHLREGEGARYRLDGKLRMLDRAPVEREAVLDFFKAYLTREELDQLEKRHEVDFSASVRGICRTRVNLYYQQGKICAAVRLIPERIPTMDEIYLPRACREFTQLTRGLVLVTGPTGCGKSTTLAAMIDAICGARPVHILTIEDPIEFVYPQKIGTVSQREVGRDTADHADALRYAFRQNPDVVMLGEMRDMESMAAAVTLAETGHLTFSTLHTLSAAQTIHRIVDAFPPHHQNQLRTQLAVTLEGIINQRLLPLHDRTGRVAAREVLVCNLAVKNLIRENKISHIASVIQTGFEEGMISMTRSLAHLVERGLVSMETALGAAQDKRELLEALGKTPPGHGNSLPRKPPPA